MNDTTNSSTAPVFCLARCLSAASQMQAFVAESMCMQADDGVCVLYNLHAFDASLKS